MDAKERLLVVVGVDGSAPADRALAWAVRMAHRLGAVAERVQVDSAARVLPTGGATAIAMQTVQGAPGPVLVEAARRADLLVIGSHRHHKRYSMLMGSTSEECVRHAQCPVVVIPVLLHGSGAVHDDVAVPTP